MSLGDISKDRASCEWGILSYPVSNPCWKEMRKMCTKIKWWVPWNGEGKAWSLVLQGVFKSYVSVGTCQSICSDFQYLF